MCKLKILNNADAGSFRLFYQAEQEALAETGDEIVLDGGPGLQFHRQALSPLGGGGDQGERVRKEMVADCEKAIEYRFPVPRSCDKTVGTGSVTCVGTRPNRKSTGYDVYRRRSTEPESPAEKGWLQRFQNGTCARLYRALQGGSEAELRDAAESAEELGLPCIIGPYPAAAVFHDKVLGMTPAQIEHQGGVENHPEWLVGYAPGEHTDDDFAPCMIVNLRGRGWMVYPEYKVAIEFWEGSHWVFDPLTTHCCSPSTTGRGRIGLGLYSKQALASRGEMQEDCPANSELEWDSSGGLKVKAHQTG